LHADHAKLIVNNIAELPIPSRGFMHRTGLGGAMRRGPVGGDRQCRLMTTSQPFDFHLNRPGTLIAALPAVLGFVPERSLVL